MGVGDSGERSETVILRFAIIDLTTIILNRFLSILELLSNRRYE